jgi:hypothetical protein
MELPPAVSGALGLDDGRHWLRFDELNGFVWPGFDLRPIAGGDRRYDYGMLPQDLFERLRIAILEAERARRGMIVPRD